MIKDTTGQHIFKVKMKDRLEKLQIDALHLIIPDNTCIFCLTSIELADAYSLDTIIDYSLRKDPWAFYLHMVLPHQAFSYCGRFPTTTSQSLGCSKSVRGEVN